MVDRNKYQKFVEGLRAGIEEGLIKVHFTLDSGVGETVWAHPIGKKYAKIRNVPVLMDDVSLDDIVEIEPSDRLVKEFVRLVSRGTYKTFIKWATKETEEDTRVHFKEMYLALERAGISVGSAVPGISMITAPTSMPLQEVTRILDTSPYIIEHGFGGLDESNFDVDINGLSEDE